MELVFSPKRLLASVNIKIISILVLGIVCLISFSLFMGASAIPQPEDSTAYYHESNTCVAENNDLKITVSNCKAQDIDSRDITQYVTFEWQGGQSKDLDWLFAYDDELDDFSIYLESVRDVTTRLTNYSDCDTRQIDYGNGTIAEYTENCSEYEVVRKQKYWKDVTGQFSHVGANLMGNGWEFYKALGEAMVPGMTYRTKWVFTPANRAKSGKWRIFGMPSTDSVSGAISNDRYIFMDPQWAGGFEAWTRKKPLYVNTSTPQTRFQFNVNVSYDSDMQQNFSDLRFLTNCSNTGEEMDAWLEDKVDSNYSLVWINFSYKVSTNATLCMYYGNPNASASWDGSKTFPFFEDFEDYAVSSDLVGQGGWTGDSGAILITNQSTYEGSRSVLLTDRPTDYAADHSIPSGLGAVTIGTKARGSGSTTYNQIRILDGSTHLAGMTFRPDHEGKYLGASGWTAFSSPVTWTDNVWYSWNITTINSTTAIFCWNGVCDTDTMYNSGTIDTIRIWNIMEGVSDTTRFDAVYIANITYPTPVHSFGYKIEKNITEGEADDAIYDGIISKIPDASVTPNQKIYVRHANGTPQQQGTFDMVAVYGLQTWAFNYITDGESYADVNSIGTTLNVWQDDSLSSTEQITSSVAGFINSTLDS